MTDDETPKPDETTATTPAEPTTEKTPDDVPPPLPPATTYAEPSQMASAAADLPREETAPPVSESAPEAQPEPTEPPALPEPAPATETEPAATAAEAPAEPQPEVAAEAKKPKKPRKPKVAAAPSEPEPAPASTDPNAAPAGATADAGSAPPSDSKKKWYVVKIQSGREDSIKAAIERKVKIEGLEEYFGQIAIPVEEIVVKKSVKVKDKKTGDKVTQEKKVVKKQKKYPGYLFAEVEFNDRILYLFRETSGVGDFVGAGLKREPTPMTDREVQQMLTGVVDSPAGAKGGKGPVKVKLDYEKGDKVKIRDGPFANMEGEVKAITDPKDTGETPKVTVEVTIFGRGVPVELDYWHVDKV